MNIIPFEGKLPAYLAKADASLNADLTAHAGTGFPVLSIKGKVFALVRDGERKVLPNPKDPDSPATRIEAVLVKVNPTKSKVFYAKGYVEGSEGVKPDCFSNDGSKPDASIEKPQAKTCATCPQNVWGAKITEEGKKAKACQDSIRMAIASPDQLNDPMLLRVPPATIKAVGEYGDFLKKRGVAYQAVVTQIGFDPEAATPKLTFKAVGFLSEEAFHEVVDVAKSDVVQNILGSVFTASEAVAESADAASAAIDKAKAAAPTPSKDKTVTEDEVAKAVSAAEKPKVAAPDPDMEVDVDLDGLSFDD